MVINKEKRLRLQDAFTDAQRKTTDFLLQNNELLDDCVGVGIAIDNIQQGVQEQLTRMSQKITQTIDVFCKS